MTELLLGLIGFVGFIVWLIVVLAMVAVAGDVLGLWEAVEFV